MNFKETLDYLYAKLPMYQRIGKTAFKKDLSNTIKLCAALGNPEQSFPAVHIAGTNGKGSVSALLAATLTASGYKTGLYTSPHLKSFTERIRINGENIPQKAVVQFVSTHRKLIEEIKPSFFEITVAMAFSYFQQEKVDIAIIETGLGGRLDSTNILSPILSVITNISLDHQDLLGNSIPEIAAEKAGIIKKQAPVIIGEYDVLSAPVFEKKAEEENTSLEFADKLFHCQSIDKNWNQQEIELHTLQENKVQKLKLGLVGNWQCKNSITAYATLQKLIELGYQISPAQIRKGFEQVRKLSGLRGRFEVLTQSPLTICDVGHNEAGIKAVFAQLEKAQFPGMHIVWGMVKEKSIDTILKLLPKAATYYFVAASIQRALPAPALQQKATAYHLKGNAYDSVEAGIEAAKKLARPDELIFIGGSTFVVAEAL